MVILGIDPGLTRCGYAALEATGATTARAVALGVVRTAAADPLPARLAELRGELAALIAELQPDVVAVEHVFFQVNVRTAMSVGQASGLALAEAAAAGCEVVQYTPNQVKEAVTGWGAAGKEQVQRMVQVRLGLADATQAGRRRRRRRAGALPPGHGPTAGPRGRGDGRTAMIGSLRGTVLERGSDGRVLLEVGGVGYLVTVTPRTLAELEPTTSAFLHVHHHIREDAQTLYGFPSRSERATFDVLVATHGVGPALALAILATHTPSALVDIVASSDLASLCLVPGVGKKTAERLLVELRSRLSVPVLDDASPAGSSSAVGDVREALAGLGYGSEEIREALREVDASEHAGAAPAGRAQGPGGASCVTSSSTRRRPTSGRRSRTPASAPAASPTSWASGSSRSTCPWCSRPPAGGGRPPTTCCSPARPASARPRCRASSPSRWGCSSTSPPARRWSGPATSPPSSPSSTTATSSSSTRSTGSRAPSRRSSTRPWRTSSSTSSSGRARRPPPSG